MLAALRREADAMAGEMALCHLCAVAQDLLSAANAPEGDCPICMYPLESGSGGGCVSGGGNSAGAAAVQKLPCFHCMHRWESGSITAHSSMRSEQSASSAMLSQGIGKSQSIAKVLRERKQAEC